MTKSLNHVGKKDNQPDTKIKPKSKTCLVKASIQTGKWDRK